MDFNDWRPDSHASAGAQTDESDHEADQGVRGGPDDSEHSRQDRHRRAYVKKQCEVDHVVTAAIVRRADWKGKAQAG